MKNLTLGCDSIFGDKKSGGIFFEKWFGDLIPSTF
jgi:hypothetical protein